MHRSFWLEQALAGTADDLNPLRGAVTSDVAIVGGGFVGLWTALMIKRLEPRRGRLRHRGGYMRRRSLRTLRGLGDDVVAEDRQFDDSLRCRRSLAAGAGVGGRDRGDRELLLRSRAGSRVPPRRLAVDRHHRSTTRRMGQGGQPR